MATTLGGVTLEDPIAGADGHRVSGNDIGGEMTMADGSLRIHLVGRRKRYALKWRGLTAAQRDSIEVRSTVTSTQAYSPPESANTVAVLVRPGSFEQESINDADGTFYFDVALELEEQAAS